MARWCLASLLAAGLVSWAATGLFFVPPERQESNLASWSSMDEDGREALRAAWREFEASQGDRHDLLVRRMATLSRLIIELEQRHPKLSKVDLQRRLGRVRERLDGLLPEGGSMSERLRGRVVRQVRTLTQTLHEQGRLSSEERHRIESLPYDEAVMAALDLLKHEEIFLYAEGSVSHEPNDVVLMQSMSPLEVASRMRLERRRRGLMGRAARHFNLTATERSQLAECSDEDLVKLLRELYQPKVREYLEARQLPSEDIANILSQPLRALELSLNRLELLSR